MKTVQFRASTFFLALISASLVFADPEDWPGWRGPNANGVSAITSAPVTWSADRNVAWKTAIPGRGHSSPVVWGDRVFLTTDLEGEVIPNAGPVKHILEGQPFVHPDSVGANRKHTLKLLCYDARSGKLLWDRVAYEGPVFDDVARFNTYASPTAVTDGKFVYAYFESQGLYQYDFEGRLKWKMSLGGIATQGVGTGVSPVIVGDKVVILADQDEGANSFIAAVSAADGKIAWKTPRKSILTWTTPGVVDVDHKQQIIVPSAENVVAYEPATGKLLWETEGLEGNTVHTPVFGHGMVFVSAGYEKKKTMAIRLQPKPGESRIAWTHEKGTGYIPSPILVGDYLYLMTDGGIMTCLDARTGEVKYEGKRFPAPARFLSPPVAFDGKILVTSEDGDTYILKAGTERELLGTNSLNDLVYSSLAVSRDSIYIRSTKALYCIREPKRAPQL